MRGGASLARLSGANNAKKLTCVHRLVDLDLDRLDDTTDRGRQFVLHFHRFHNKQGLAGLDFLADRGEQRNHSARHRRLQGTGAALGSTALGSGQGQVSRALDSDAVAAPLAANLRPFAIKSNPDSSAERASLPTQQIFVAAQRLHLPAFTVEFQGAFAQNPHVLCLIAERKLVLRPVTHRRKASPWRV